MVEVIPQEKGSKEATFKGLVEDFSLDPKVLALLEASKLESLEDFRFYFADEKELDAFVAEDKSIQGKELRIQVARLRRAWVSVRQTALKREAKLSTSTVAEMDDLLGEADLRSIKVNFWKRYRLRYPAEIMPCDQIISRCYRELDRRLLTVYDVWKMRSLKHQVTVSRKRKQVGDGLFTFEEEGHDEPHRDVRMYLANLYTYLLALAIAGSARRSDAPSEESFGSDSVSFVATPWDVLQAYYFRAVEAVAAIQEASKAAWLERVDLAERAVWVSMFRDGGATVGEVVKQTMDRRGAHWDPPTVVKVDVHQQRMGLEQDFQPPELPIKEEESVRRKAGNAGAKLAPGTIASAFRDGQKLCPEFQRGECRVKAARCKKGLHRCGKVTHRGRVCGMNFHGASTCRAKA